MKYIKKYGKLDGKYFSRLNEFCKMRLVEAGRRVYNNISSYANKKLRQNPPAFDEAYTELRVKNRLKEEKE